MSTPEGKTKEKIKRFLKLYKIPYWMVVPSAMGNTTGLSDFICILPRGVFLAIEAKAEGKEKTVTANQRKFLDTINTNGGHAIVVSCDNDLIELESWLGENDYI